MIEKKIHYFWIGNRPLGEKEKKCIDSWRKFLPDFEIIKWNEKNYEFNYCKYMQDAILNKKYGFAIDVARLDVVYRYGGIYLDTDVEIIRPFDNFILNNKAICCFEGKRGINFGSILGSERENPLILKLLEQYKQRSFVLDDGSLNLTTCTDYQAKDLKKFALVKLNGKTQFCSDITVFSSDYFDPKDVNTEIIKITNNTYSIHQFSGTWLTPISKKRHEVKRKLLIQHKWTGKILANLYIFFSYLRNEGIKTVWRKIKSKF